MDIFQSSFHCLHSGQFLLKATDTFFGTMDFFNALQKKKKNPALITPICLFSSIFKACMSSERCFLNGLSRSCKLNVHIIFQSCSFNKSFLCKSEWSIKHFCPHFLFGFGRTSMIWGLQKGVGTKAQYKSPFIRTLMLFFLLVFLPFIWSECRSWISSFKGFYHVQYVLIVLFFFFFWKEFIDNKIYTGEGM